MEGVIFTIFTMPMFNAIYRKADGLLHILPVGYWLGQHPELSREYTMLRGKVMADGRVRVRAVFGVATQG